MLKTGNSALPGNIITQQNFRTNKSIACAINACLSRAMNFDQISKIKRGITPKM